MKVQGIVPKNQVLDNEISAAYRMEIKTTNMNSNFQIIPPDDHRRNFSEKEIQIWKYHIIGVMSGTSAELTSHLWCQEITQSERQLLLL